MTTARDVVNAIRARTSGHDFVLTESEAELMVNLFASCELVKAEKSELEAQLSAVRDGMQEVGVE